MNGVHDLGGMQGLGPIGPEPNEPVFHEDWEAHAFAALNLTLASGFFNVDELRHAIERMPPAEYLETPYYVHWIHAIEDLLVRKGAVTQAELAARQAELSKAGAV